MLGPVLDKTKLFFPMVMCLAVLGCTSAGNVQQTLIPEPVAAPQAVATDQAVDTSTSNQTALAAETVATPGQNVVDQQLSSDGQVQVAALDVANSISFLPVEGMPQTSVTSLSRSLQQSAQVHGINLVPANQPKGKYRVKGYFSALNDGTGTLVTYIWDVVDLSGKRLHRINGQERNGSTNSNPWSTVTDDQLKNVADTTASRLKSWLDSRS